MKSNQIKHFDLVTQLLGVNSIKMLYISHKLGSFPTLVSHLSQMTLPESLWKCRKVQNLKIMNVFLFLINFCSVFFHIWN